MHSTPAIANRLKPVCRIRPRFRSLVRMYALNDEKSPLDAKACGMILLNRESYKFIIQSRWRAIRRWDFQQPGACFTIHRSLMAC